MVKKQKAQDHYLYLYFFVLREQSLIGIHILDSSHHTIHLSKGKHATMERIASIERSLLIAKDTATVIDTHWETKVLLLKVATNLEKVDTASEVICLNEVGV